MLRQTILLQAFSFQILYNSSAILPSGTVKFRFWRYRNTTDTQEGLLMTGTSQHCNAKWFRKCNLSQLIAWVCAFCTISSNVSYTEEKCHGVTWRIRQSETSTSHRPLWSPYLSYVSATSRTELIAFAVLRFYVKSVTAQSKGLHRDLFITRYNITAGHAVA
jgi:hypothetical protein